MTDIAYVINLITPGAQYRGSLTNNTKTAYDEIIWLDARPKPAWENIIAHPQANGITPDDVRKEAQRRMIKLVGARDADDLAIKIQNALRESARLLEKEINGTTLTPEEETRKQALMTMDAAIEAIRDASNVLEAMTPVPADYKADSWWPQ